jgi:hypothetical protein
MPFSIWSIAVRPALTSKRAYLKNGAERERSGSGETLIDTRMGFL